MDTTVDKIISIVEKIVEINELDAQAYFRAGNATAGTVLLVRNQGVQDVLGVLKMI